MPRRALAVYLGREAARRIAEQGWSPELFDLLLGASGGAKWLILGHLDRLLFGDFLARRQRPLAAIGSSIGSWRHACLALPDPVAAIDRFEAAYLEQHYTRKPGAAEVSEVSRGILDRLFGEDGVAQALGNRRVDMHIVTARARGVAGASSGAMLDAAMGSAALGNSISRRLLRTHFQRVVFHSPGEARVPLSLHDFDTVYGALDEHNLKAVLHASGSIPFVLSGERDIPPGPAGQYWDGGIIDYHFDLAQYRGAGLALYPHFSARVFPGWFDKFLPWRSTALHRCDNLVLLCPRPEFIADLPQGKIPDRSDFTRMPHEERLRYWRTCIERSRVLAEEFAELLQAPDPLAGTVVLDQESSGANWPPARR
ncbi:MAG: alpha/beta hydrolase [Halioglobus sp.]|nr:alpha/beta hydrolase [Halioglobus sp.]